MAPIVLYTYVSAALFCLGILCIAARRSAVRILMGVELVLNAAALNFVAFARLHGTGAQGQLLALFVIVLSVAEAAVALAIVLAIRRRFRTIEADSIASLHG